MIRYYRNNNYMYKVYRIAVEDYFNFKIETYRYGEHLLTSTSTTFGGDDKEEITENEFLIEWIQ